jgi:hypothetical protein
MPNTDESVIRELIETCQNAANVYEKATEELTRLINPGREQDIASRSIERQFRAVVAISEPVESLSSRIQNLLTACAGLYEIDYVAPLNYLAETANPDLDEPWAKRLQGFLDYSARLTKHITRELKAKGVLSTEEVSVIQQADEAFANAHTLITNYGNRLAHVLELRDTVAKKKLNPGNSSHP